VYGFVAKDKKGLETAVAVNLEDGRGLMTAKGADGKLTDVKLTCQLEKLSNI
jgi:hypothetical protein